MSAPAPYFRELGRSVELDAALAVTDPGGDPITSVMFVEAPDGTRLAVETLTRARVIPSPLAD